MYQKLTTSALTALRAALLSVSDTDYAGKTRSAFNSRIAALRQSDPSKIVLKLSQFGAPVGFTADGQLVNDPDELATVSEGWCREIRELVPTGSAPANKVLSVGEVMPCGLTMVLGGADKAKTPLTHLLASDRVESYAAIRYGEPLAGSELDESALARALCGALLDPEVADIVLDSVKDLLASASGGAMKSGIARGVLPIISNLSVICAEAGVTVYSPINPSTADPALMEDWKIILKSNVVTAVVPGDGDEWIFTSRRGEGLKRNNYAAKVAFNDDGLLHFKSNLVSAARTSIATVKNFSRRLTDEAFANLLTRALTQKD